MSESTLLKFEIVPADLGLEPSEKSSLELMFTGFFGMIDEWKTKASVCSDPKEARAHRLEMKKERVEFEKKVKAAKANALLYGKACDGIKNIYLSIAGPVEAAFDEIEKAEERAEAARIEAVREDRVEALETLGHVTHGLNLGKLTDEEWSEYYQQAKDSFFARRERERKAKEEAEALAKKEAEEREAQRLENIRLREEADKREAELAEARLIAAKKDAEAKAEKATLEAEAKSLRDAEATRIAHAEGVARAKAKALADAAKKEAAAPDKAKLLAFASNLLSLASPQTKTAAGKAMEAEIEKRIEALALWINSQAATL
jgi:hypothetical protein